ncbi:hypothetical protein, partial [Micromonospora sp. ATCC 39149]
MHTPSRSGPTPARDLIPRRRRLRRLTGVAGALVGVLVVGVAASGAPSPAAEAAVAPLAVAAI